MKENIFLIDGTKRYTYDVLLEAVNNRNFYVPEFQSTSLYDFYVNLLTGLVSNNPVTLLDSDISKSERDSLVSDNTDKKKEIAKDPIIDFEDLIEKVRESSSEVVIFTSGTTGQPKEVRHTIPNLSRSVKTGERFRNNIWGFAYNPTHMAGLQVFLQAFMNGNPLVNIFNKDRTYIFSEIECNGITHISATPTFYRLLLPYEKEYRSIERISFGGEKSDQNLYETIKKIFPLAKVTNIYASTEAGTLFATQGDSFKIPEAIRDKFRIVDDELYIHKSLLGSSSSFRLDDEYYASGDLIEWVDIENGLFRFKSRRNELINVGGYKVNPSEVEESLRKIPGIREARVYGRKNSILGNILCADVVAENSTLSETDIKTALKNQLQDFKIPRRIKFVESLTLTRTGKMSRK